MVSESDYRFRITLLLTLPLPWASVHWLVQRTPKSHCNTTGWPSIHWDNNRWHSQYLQGTLGHHWKNLVETVPHWNATGETDYCGILRNPPPPPPPPPHGHIQLSRAASMPVWNDKKLGHRAASGQVSVSSAFTWSLLLYNAYLFCSSNVWVLQHHTVQAYNMRTIIILSIFGCSSNEISLAQTTTLEPH